MLNRRGLLTGLGALIAAPAIVRAGSLMPVRRPFSAFDRLTAADVREMRDIFTGISQYVGVTLSYDDGAFHARWITREEYYRDFGLP